MPGIGASAPAGLLALATRNTEFYSDRVFDPAEIARMRASLQPMATPWLTVHRRAAQRGLRIVTADRVLTADGVDPRTVQLIAYDWTPDAETLVARGARACALVSFEPPVIAWSLYAQLPTVSARFEHVFLFEGARPRARTRFHRLLFPQPCPPPQAPASRWRERRFLVMVNSNKALPRVTSPGRWLDRPREVSLKRALAALRYRPIANDRYGARLAAIAAFADRPDFDLFGEGWTRRHPAVRARVHARALHAYRGPVDDKLELLGQYRFALAIENTRFAGYVSEKLFDCLFAGTIPVYDGAPDVADYVPEAAFVDARRFASLAALERYLRGLSEADAERYLAAGRAFLASSSFERFCADAFASALVDAVQ